MKHLAGAMVVSSVILSTGLLLSAGITADSKPNPVGPNPVVANPAIANLAIDMDGYLRVSADAAKHRQTRRLSEADFIRMSAEEGTIVLDARSKAMYDLLHVKGAINLSFSDIAVESLKKTLPDKETRILIYCNNNFRNAEAAFPSKLPTASLNLSTFIALYNYGYKNVYELGPQIDPKNSKLTLVSAPPKQK